MNNDYFDFLKLIYLLHAITSILKNKYGELDVDEIKIYELDADINKIERLVDGISFKKHKIIEQMLDEYVKAYEQEFQEQAKVNNNE